MKYTGGGLIPTGKDRRDIKLPKLVGAFPLSKLPANFELIDTFPIDDQGFTDLCGAYASTNMSAEQEGVNLDPNFQFAMARFIAGWNGFGCDLRSYMKSLCKIGSLARDKSPFSWQKDGRNFIADHKNWPEYLKVLALPFKKRTYVSVAGPHDLFDDIRVAIYIQKNRVITGCKWSPDWNTAIIPETYREGGDSSGHAFIIRGWRTINNKLFLIIRNSWGIDNGDNGLYYMSRKVANKELPYGGAYTVVDITPEEAKRISWGIIEKLIDILTKGLTMVGKMLGL